MNLRGAITGLGPDVLSTVEELTLGACWAIRMSRVRPSPRFLPHLDFARSPSTPVWGVSPPWQRHPFWKSSWCRTRTRGDGTVQVVVTLMPDEAQRVFTAVEAMRDAMREECPSLPPTYADAFVRLVDVGYEEATVELAHSFVDPDVTNDSAESSLATHVTDDSAESHVATSCDHARDNDDDHADSPSRGAHTANHSDHESAESRLAKSDPTSNARAHPTRHLPPNTEAHPRPTAVRKKVSGGDTQRVIIQLAPHLLSDGLVANLDDGTWIAPETWRRVACDCALELVKVDEAGVVLDVGRRTRTISPAIARALDVRDAHRCRFPNCNHRRFLDRHHLEHWSRGGETKLDNLLTLCTAHHQLVHEGGWTVEHIGSALTRGPIVSRNRAASRTTSAVPRTIPLQTDGEEARFFRPDGTPLVWPRMSRVDDVVAELEEAHAELEIGATTGLTLWNGKTPEYASCVEAVCRG